MLLRSTFVIESLLLADGIPTLFYLFFFILIFILIYSILFHIMGLIVTDVDVPRSDVIDPNFILFIVLIV